MLTSMPRPPNWPVVPIFRSLNSFGVEKGGVRVEPAEHAANGVFDQFLFVDRLDVVGFDLGEDLGKGLQVLEWNFLAVLERIDAVADRELTVRAGLRSETRWTCVDFCSIRVSVLPRRQLSRLRIVDQLRINKL